MSTLKYYAYYISVEHRCGPPDTTVDIGFLTDYANPYICVGFLRSKRSGKLKFWINQILWLS